MRRSLASLFIILCAACGAPQARPLPPGALTGMAGIYGWIDAPEPVRLTLRTGRAPQSRVVDSGLMPSGLFHFDAPAGRYVLEITPARPGAFPPCIVELLARSDLPNNIEELFPPSTCPVPLWSRAENGRARTKLRGSPASVKTALGEYDGYRLLPCTNPRTGGLFALVGAGKDRLPENGDRTHDHDFEEWVTRVRGRIGALFPPMFGGAGFGESCRADTPAGVIVYVSDYRQVDEVIRRVGRLIREDDLGGTFSIELMEIIEEDLSQAR